MQVICFILEFAGESALRKGIKTVKKDIRRQHELRPEARKVIEQFFEILLSSISFLKTVHRGLFYLNGGTYQISKRLTGINYVSS